MCNLVDIVRAAVAVAQVRGATGERQLVIPYRHLGWVIHREIADQIPLASERGNQGLREVRVVEDVLIGRPGLLPEYRLGVLAAVDNTDSRRAESDQATGNREVLVWFPTPEFRSHRDGKSGQRGVHAVIALASRE